MKKIKKFVAVILLSLTLFNTTFNSYNMAVQAAALPVTFGLVEIAKGLLFSAGISVLGYTALSNVKKGDDTYVKIMDSVTADADVQSMLEEVEKYDSSGACHNLDEGEEYVSDKGFRVIKGGKGNNNNNNDANKYALGVSTAIAQKVAESIKKFIDSDDNKQTVTVKTPYDKDIDKNHVFKSYDSINDIADLYGKQVVEKLAEKGYTDENCCVILFRDNLSSNLLYYFIPVPKNHSYIGYVAESGTSEISAWSAIMSVIDTKSFYEMLNSDLVFDRYDDYIYSRRIPFDAVYYDFVNNKFLEYDDLPKDSKAKTREYRNTTNYFYSDYMQDDYLAIFNFDNMADNTHLWLKFRGRYMNIETMFPQSVSYAINKKPGSVPWELPESGYVNINFDEDTASDLESQPDINQYYNYVINNSPDLSEVIDNMNNNQAQDNENAQDIVDAIDNQTSWLESAWLELLAAINAGNNTGNSNGPIDTDSGNGAKDLLNGLIMLISIFFILLRIFLHLLEFIINIFRIPADPGFISGDFAIGFEYIKSVQLTPLTISVYDFLIGLVHVLVLFSVVKVLKKHIDRIHV